MPLYKDSFDKAKRHAHERLTGWITDIRQENEAGIERLQRQFKHTFKKIEYVPKDIQRRRTNEEKVLLYFSGYFASKSSSFSLLFRSLFNYPTL